MGARALTAVEAFNNFRGLCHMFTRTSTSIVITLISYNDFHAASYLIELNQDVRATDRNKTPEFPELHSKNNAYSSETRVRSWFTNKRRKFINRRCERRLLPASETWTLFKRLSAPACARYRCRFASLPRKTWRFSSEKNHGARVLKRRLESELNACFSAVSPSNRMVFNTLRHSRCWISSS